MDLINNRYRIIKSTKQSRMVSTYLVNDIVKSNKGILLNIINSEYFNDNLISFYIREFLKFINIDTTGIIKNYDFGIIQSIDNKKISNKQYYYTNEYINADKNNNDVIQKLSLDKKLELFIMVCQTIYYLHIRGMIYGELSLNALFIDNNEGNYNIKLKDLATVELERQNYWNVKRDSLFFKAPETLYDGKNTERSDIYSLGVLLLTVLKKKINDYTNFEQELEQFKEDYILNKSISEKYRDFSSKLYPIILKMTDQNEEKRYNSIREIVKEINLSFDKNYSVYRIEEVEKLNFNTKLVGRDYELNSIINTYDTVIKLGQEQRVISVHGEYGIGKTKFLTELKRILIFKNANIFSSFTLESFKFNGNRALVGILRKIISQCDSELFERYEADLVKYMPEIGVRRNITPIDTLGGEKEKARLINSILRFLNDFIKNKPVVFMIDDLHLSDEITIEILEKITLVNKNIMLVFSFNDTLSISNERFCKFLSKINSKNNTMDFPLHGLNAEETAYVVQGVLNYSRPLLSLGKRIYSKTYGNPLFIEEVLKSLFSNKLIYVSSETGIWNSEYDPIDYDKIPMSTNMEQTVLNQIKEIDEQSYEILKILSIFNTGISAETIKSFICIDSKCLQNIIENLEHRGVLCKKIEDMGFVYDFSNRILKRLIYEKIDEEDKKEKHSLAAFILEKQLQDGGENKEELIYHLEKANEKEKVIKYCLENAEMMEKFKNRNEAIKNLKKAISMIDKDSLEERKIKLCIKIGNLYEEDVNGVYAIKYYEKAERLSVKSKNIKYQLEVLNKIANVYFKKNSLQKTQKYIKKVQKILSEVEDKVIYLESYLECLNIQCDVYLIKQEYSIVYDLCLEGIKLCGDEHIKFKGLFYKLLGNRCLQTSNIDEALVNYKESMKCFEEIKYTEGVLIVLNNIGVVYGDYKQDDEMAISNYNKMKEVSRKSHFITSEILALSNLGFSYLYNDKYELALQYFEEALEKSKKVDYESLIFYCYNYLSNVNLRLNEYEEAYKYYLLCEKELEVYPEHGKEMAGYYQISAELFYSFGSMDKAESLIKKALEIYNNDESRMKWESELLLQYIEIHKKTMNESIEENLEDIRNIVNKYDSPKNKIKILYNTAMLLYENDHSDLSLEFLEDANYIEKNCELDRIEAKGFYLKSIYAKGSNKLKYLTEAYKITKVDKEKNLHWKICNAIGDYYFSKKNYFYAVNYYFEACEVIKNLTLQLPKECREDFVASYGLVSPFNKLNTIKNYEDYSKLHKLEDKDIISSYRGESIEDIFDYENFKNILTNKYFINSAKKIYNAYLPAGIRDVRDIVKNLYEDSIKNLELIAKYLASITLATKCLIVVDSFEEKYYTLASNDGNNNIPQNRYIFEKAKASKKDILITDKMLERDRTLASFMSSDTKAVICIPIIMSTDEVEYYIKEDKRKTIYSPTAIKGYIYLQADRILNNFNEETLEMCKELSKLAGCNIEKHQLKISSSIDRLTGVLTRKFLEEALSYNIEKANELEGIFSVIIVDLDHFKHINDRFGHQVGDEALRKVCSIIKNNIRKEDVCGRYGGEEFVIILPETDSKDALVVSEKLRHYIEGAKILGDENPVTVSMGIASYPEHGQWKQDLIEKADKALYVCKELGRNRCQIWDSKFSSKAKITNKLTGIVSGNTVQDSRNVLAMVDIIELIKQDIDLEEKIHKLLGRVIEITESQKGIFFIVEDGIIKEAYSRKIFDQEWVENPDYNKEIVNSVIQKKQGIYMTDWDDSTKIDSITGALDWQSIVVVPLINCGKVKGVLYLSVSISEKEFKFDEFNFINTLGDIAASVL